MKIDSKSGSPSYVLFGADAQPTTLLHALGDVRVGDILRAPSRRLTCSHAEFFPAAPPDGHSAHCGGGGGGCRADSMPVSPGMQDPVFGVSEADLFPDLLGKGAVRFLEMSFRFMAEVRAGDVLHPMLIVTDLRSQNEENVVTARATMHKQNGELVLSGQYKYYLQR
ncbi:MaoC family dehydratase [Streptomyces sp. NPDC006516]|uniref:MaoC family dehydratase n=1 Tax=Streptomyces sp. NPDC006516 TaxID=3154309 RepID=UPI0033AB6CE8